MRREGLEEVGRKEGGEQRLEAEQKGNWVWKKWISND